MQVAIGDPNIADVVVVSPRELLVNGRAIGNTTLIVWGVDEAPRSYTIEVSVDVAGVQRLFATLFPDENLQVTAQATS